MTMLEDIVAYIDANLTRTAGVDLFGNVMPELPINCISVHQPSGMEPMEVYGPNGKPPVEMPRLQIMVRGATYADSYAVAKEVWELISAICDQTLSGTYYQRIAAQDSVQSIGFDNNKNPLWSMNFQVWKDT